MLSSAYIRKMKFRKTFSDTALSSDEKRETAPENKPRKHTIRAQIRHSMIGISVIIMLVLALGFYLLYARNLESNYQDDFTYSLEMADRIMEIRTDSVIDLMRNLLTDSSYMDTLYSPEDANRGYFTSSQMRTLESASSQITRQSSQVANIASISPDGRLYLYSLLGSGAEYQKLYQGKTLVDADWVQKAREKEGRETVVGENVLTGESDVLSITKCMISPVDGKIRGYLVVTIQNRLYQQAFAGQGRYHSNRFMLIDKSLDDRCVYYSGTEDTQEEFYRAFTDGGQSGYVFSTLDSGFSDFQLVSGIRRSELLSESWRMAAFILAILAVLILACVIVSWRISSRIYQPLGRLENTIRLAKEGSRHITEQFDDSEIGLIGQEFTGLVNRNLMLRERLLTTKIRQREQELMVLQERINPHFLYNTLDALYCMAEIHGTEDIAVMVEALSETFRLSLNKGSHLIPVSEEIRHIQAYMTIQNMRFNDRFTLDIDVDQELMQVQILKLILEPFVENSVVHGLEPKMDAGHILLSGRKEDDHTIVFVIQDDGVGVDSMEKLHQGYGFSNVCERIRLYYGKNSGVTAESCEDGGLKITVRIMLKDGEWDDDTI